MNKLFTIKDLEDLEKQYPDISFTFDNLLGWEPNTIDEAMRKYVEEYNNKLKNENSNH